MRIPGLVLLFALAATSTPAPGQRRADAALPGPGTLRADAAVVTVAPVAPRSQSPSFSGGHRFPVRAATAGLGWLGGVFVGGALGYIAVPHCNGCEDPGLEGLLLGAIAGSLVGTPALAAAPAMGDGCRYGDRFGRAFLGTLGGTVLGVLLGTATVPLVLPVTASLGASAATLGCRRVAPAAPTAPAPPGS